MNEKKDKYILDENKNIIPATLLEWGEWLENAGDKKIVKQENVGDYFISTVFLGLDHNWISDLYKTDSHRPHIFETMIFHNEGNYIESYCRRCSTWQEAEAQHKRAVQWVKNGCKDDE